MNIDSLVKYVSTYFTVFVTHSSCHHRDTIDSVKQSAGLTLLRLLRASPDMIPIGEWTSRIIHLLNDQHMVSNRLYLLVINVSLA